MEEKFPGPALEQSRKWNQKEAVQAMDAFLNVKNPQGVKNCPLFQSPAETALKDDKTPPGSPMGGKNRKTEMSLICGLGVFIC